MWMDANGLDYGENSEGVIDGSGDGGIDAIARPMDIAADDKIFLIQAKYYRKTVPDKTLNSFFRAVNAFRKNATRQEFNEWLEPVRRNLKDKYTKIWNRRERVQFVLVTSGNLSPNIKSRLSRNSVSRVEKSKVNDIFLDMIRGKSPRPSKITVGNISALTEPVSKNRRHNLFVLPLRIFDLCKAYQEHSNDLFAGNIRYALSTENAKRVTSGIDETLKNNPGEFSYFHNGITIVCKKVKFSAKNIELLSPSIVNGAQTVTHIGKKNPQTISKKASVITKIVEVKAEGGFEEYETEIAMSSNTQNPVKFSDLMVIDPNLVSLEKFLKSKKVFLERKKGSTSIWKPIVKLNKDLLLQLIASVDQKSIGPSYAKDVENLYKRFSHSLFKKYAQSTSNKRDVLGLVLLFFLVKEATKVNHKKKTTKKKMQSKVGYSSFTVFSSIYWVLKDKKVWNRVRNSMILSGYKEGEYIESLQMDVRLVQKVILKACNDNKLGLDINTFFKNREQVKKAIKKARQIPKKRLKVLKV